MSSASELPLVQWTTLIIQVVTVVAVVVYVWKTWEMAKATLETAKASAGTLEEMRAARREASAPRPIIYFGTDSVHLSEIIVENVGQVTAADLTFSFTPPLQASQQSGQATKFFDTPKQLPPGARLRHAFDSWPQYFGANLPLQYSVVMRYRRPNEATIVEETQVLDAAGFQFYMQWRRYGLHEVVEELQKHVKAFERAEAQSSSSRKKALAAEGLTPTAMEMNEAICLLCTLWTAYKAMDASDRVIAWIDPFLFVMRRATITAMFRAESVPTDPQLREHLLSILLALHAHSWDTMAVAEVESELDAAISALRDRLPDSGSSPH